MDEIESLVDPDTLEAVHIRVPSSSFTRNSIEVVIGASGAKLTVEGEDPRWVRATFGEVSNEVQKSVPSWSWLRKPWGWICIATTLAVAASIAFWSTAKSTDDTSLASARIALLFWSTLGGGGIGFVLWELMKAVLLPGFDLLRDRIPSRGGQVIGLSASILLAFGVGVMVNLIS